MATFNRAFPYCLTVSLIFHALIVLLWPKAGDKLRSPAPISISVLEAPKPAPAPPPEERRETRPNRATRMAREAPTRPSKAQAIIAKKSSPTLDERPLAPREARQEKDPRIDTPPPREKTAPREEPQQQVASAERQLPSLKELLPPITYSSNQKGGGAGGPVSLNTKDPQFVTYFGSIKQSIELAWQYPDMALKYGLQGKLLLEFIVLNNGELQSAVVLRSSGSHLLDDEALRAVKAAAPFKPIPPWLGKDRIDIIATFEYLDNRLNYRVMQ